MIPTGPPPIAHTVGAAQSGDRTAQCSACRYVCIDDPAARAEAMLGPNHSTGTSSGQASTAQHRLVVAEIADAPSERTPCARMFASVIGGPR